MGLGESVICFFLQVTQHGTDNAKDVAVHYNKLIAYKLIVQSNCWNLRLARNFLFKQGLFSVGGTDNKSWQMVFFWGKLEGLFMYG